MTHYWVLRRNGDGWYVCPPGRRKSYSPFADHARRYGTADAAARDACGNERVEMAPRTQER